MPIAARAQVKKWIRRQLATVAPCGVIDIVRVDFQLRFGVQPWRRRRAGGFCRCFASVFAKFGLNQDAAMENALRTASEYAV